MILVDNCIKHIWRITSLRGDSFSTPSLSDVSQIRYVHATLLIELHACCYLRRDERRPVAQSSRRSQQLDCSSSFLAHRSGLLPHCRRSSPRLCRQQDTGRTRSGSDDCLGLQALLPFKYDAMQAIGIESELERLGREILVSSAWIMDSGKTSGKGTGWCIAI